MKSIKYYITNKFLSIVTIIVILLSSFLEVKAALLLTTVLDALINSSIKKFVFSVLITLVVWIISILLNAYGQRLEECLKQRIILGIRKDIIATLDYISYEDFLKQGASSYVSKLTTDMNIIEEKLIENQFHLLTMVFKILGSIVALFSFHISLVIAVFILAIMLFIIPILFQNNIERANRAVSKAYDTVINNSTHWLKGFNVIHSYQKTDYLKSKLIIGYNILSESKIQNTNTNSKIGAAIGIINVISQLVIIMISGVLAYNKIIPLGSLLSTGNLTGSIFNSLAMGSVALSDIAAGTAIFNDLLLPTEKNTVINSQQIEDVKTIEVKNLTYTFENGRTVEYPDFVLKKGKNYALVGKSGSGKSTLFNILTGRYTQYSGEIFVNGIEFRKLSDNTIGSFTRYVEQDSYVFNTTVLENLTLSQNEKYSEDSLINSLQKSRSIECINKLDKGLNTTLSKNNLSGGEAQRLNIARIFLSLKPVLLFDEITANSDSESANEINRNISKIPDCLKITITHDNQGINAGFYDEIIAL